MNVREIAARSPSGDVVAARALHELSSFTGWLHRYGVQGYIGEVGWPDDSSGDGAEWNRLADRWFRAADAAGLWVTVWATGEWWGTGYPLAVYEDRPPGKSVNAADSQAAMLERHIGSAGVLRGVNVAGGEFASPERDPTSDFSNRNPGAYNVAYHYDSAATFRFLASRGIRLVRIPFRWERIQPSLGDPLDQNEARRLARVIGRAHGAGLRVILDLHNYGGFYEDQRGRGVLRHLGEGSMDRDFADVWRRLARRFRGTPGVVGFDLMNEPIDVVSSGGRDPAEVWRAASQLAVEAIRSTGDGTLVLVEGFGYAGVQGWPNTNPRPWIRDPADNVRYEAHQYFDLDHSGTYGMTYAQEEAALRSGD